MTTTVPIAPIVDVAPAAPSDEVIARAVEVLSRGGVIAFPTDTLYGIGCQMDHRQAIDRIQAMRGFDSAKRPLTLLLPDVGELPRYAIVGEPGFRIVTRIFPGPYCAEMLASPGAPTSFVHKDRRTIGVRIPDTAFCARLLWALRRPMLTATAKARDGGALATAQDIAREYGGDLDLIVDGGELSGPPSTVVSLVDDWVTVLREGKGPPGRLLAE